MLLLHSIIVFGALLVSSRANSNPYMVVAEPEQEESNDIPLDFENFGVENLPGNTYRANVCQSKECRLTSQEFLGNLNKSVDPCKDFYEYACGGRSKNNPNPATESTWNSLKNIERNSRKRMREILEEPEKDSDTAAVKVAKKFHQSCMDLEAIEKVGIKLLEPILETYGGWPMIMKASEWDHRRISWKKIHEKYQLFSRGASLFSVTVGADLDRNVNVIKLKQHDRMSSAAMLIKLHQDPEERSYYTKYIEDVALTFVTSMNSNVSSKEISKDIADMIDFEISLHELDDYQPSDGNLITVEILKKLYKASLPTHGKSKVNWVSTLRGLFHSVGIRINKTDKILLSNYRFFTKLAPLLEKTSQRTIVNYLHWKFVSAMMPYLNQKMRDMNFLLNKLIFGVTEQKPRWETCISENPFKDALSYQFVQKYLPKTSEKKIMDMVNEIQDQVEIQISNSKSLSDKSKSQAKEKLRNIAKFIGFPNWFNNVSEIIDVYKDFTVYSSYVYNILSYNYFSTRKNLKKLLQPIDNAWLTDTFTVNEYRDFIKNSLILPTTTLQLALFDASRPNAVNYGAIGTIIGHELSYPYKNLEYEHKNGKCFLDQLFDNEKKQFEMLKDSLLKIMDIYQIENIADIAGLRTAYKAYQSKLAAGGITEEKLPGLEGFSSEQIFFLSFANNWCKSSKRKKLFYDDMMIKLHVEKFKVKVSVSNTPGFSEAFQCPAGSPMNPAVKCNIWN